MSDTKAMNLTKFESDQIRLLARYHPYQINEVKAVYVRCGKSFDRTQKALGLASAYNSIEVGILEANKPKRMESQK